MCYYHDTIIIAIISWITSWNSSLSSWLTLNSLFRPNKFVVLPEYGRGQSQFWQAMCFMLITESRLWHSHFFHHVVPTSRVVVMHTTWYCLGGWSRGQRSFVDTACAHRLSQCVNFYWYIALSILSHNTMVYVVATYPRFLFSFAHSEVGWLGYIALLEMWPRHTVLQRKRAKLPILETFSCSAWHTHQICWQSS